MPHPLERALQAVHTLKEPGYLLTTVDILTPSNYLLDLAALEVAEVVSALHSKDNEASQEFADILVFYFSWMMIHAPEVHPTDNLYSVNGFGKHSYAFERLLETILDSQDDMRAVSEVLRRVWSIAVWNPFAQLGLAEMDRVIEKVKINYPLELFTNFDQVFNRQSNPEEAIVRYEHLRAGLKLIRAFCNQNLKRTDWLPYVTLLQDWQHSAVALAQLQNELQNKRNHSL